MKNSCLISETEKDTIRFGKLLAENISKGDIVCLFGDLGAGKTTLVKGIADALKINKNKVNSPTFVFLQIYKGILPIYHFDLYRVNKLNEVNLLGYEEFLYGDGISVVEWADKLSELMPDEYLGIKMTHRKPIGRNIRLLPKGKKYKDLTNKLLNKCAL